MGDSRMNSPNDQMVEMRFDVPRAVFDVVDAFRSAKRLSKDAIGRMIVTDWAREQMHVHKVMGNVTRGKAIDAPSGWEHDGE